MAERLVKEKCEVNGRLENFTFIEHWNFIHVYECAWMDKSRVFCEDESF